jgi:RNA polymerase-binding transcription factor DksA
VLGGASRDVRAAFTSRPTSRIDPRADLATASVTGVSDAPHTPANDSEPVDLDAVQRDLAAVERALERLSDGTYWTDEVTGEPIPAHVLAADPTTRRA